MSKWKKLARAVDQARGLKVVFCGVDGVTFDGSIETFSGSIEIDKQSGIVTGSSRNRSTRDGQGVSLFRAAGIHVAFLGNETDTAIAQLVQKWNNLPSAKNGTWEPVHLVTGVGGQDKVVVAEQFLAKLGVRFEECAYLGNDIIAAGIMQRVGFPACTADAEEVIKELSLFVSERPGGRGGLRDLADFVLGVRNIDQLTLPFN